MSTKSFWLQGLCSPDWPGPLKGLFSMKRPWPQTAVIGSRSRLAIVRCRFGSATDLEV